jgi:hypothetical protein
MINYDNSLAFQVLTAGSMQVVVVGLSSRALCEKCTDVSEVLAAV